MAAPRAGSRCWSRATRAGSHLGRWRSPPARSARPSLDFGNDVIYDLLIMGQATARANARDIIEPGDLPITKGRHKAACR
jgi:Domain of unknown function (DUF1931)